ncbi:Nucleotidyl transferase [Streptomyces sp. Termitarium-T10T-6]|nr:Nucleotidyl transferase [Streptomyces sp. Termitarium-T10T-6]
MARGSRLRPYTDDRPKPMVEIPGTGTPIIGHQLSWLAAEGVTDAVVSCGHLAEVLQEWLEEAVLPLRVTTVVEKEPLGARRRPAVRGRAAARRRSAVVRHER